ncbi:MAG: DUF4838 domain-containing protein, partial [Ruminococcaceae bacterium]|nr:DUF4838 domain-containing protein [Oscillospiraceae bacterium]
TAAEFLKNVIKTSCGTELPISDKKTAHSILIGTREPCGCVKHDGFRITTDENNVYLDGNIARGTLYAAFDFAEKYIGYRYFYDDCEVIPTEGESEVPSGLDIVDNPVFAARRTTCWQHRRSGELSAHSRLNDCVPVGEAHGGVEPANGDCHSFARLCPSSEYFAEHPEYYALHDGKRVPCESGWGPGQLCLTNPDVLHIVTENVLKQLRENPEMKIVEVSQADNQKFCQCERCAAVDAEEGSQSGTMIRFVNAVAEAVEKEFPHVLVRTFAYQYTRKAPKITKARHNVLVRYCTIEACFRHALNDPDCSSNSAVFRTELEEWGRMAQQISVWDYITNWSCFAAPFPNLYTLRKNARFFAENNALHVLEESNGGYSGGLTPEMKAYLMGKLLWNPYMSDEEYEGHITDFLSHFYGKGWREIRHVIDVEHETTEHRCIGCFDDVDVGVLHFMSVPEVEGIKRFIQEYFIPRPYQPTLSDHYLMGFIERLDEIKAGYDRALALCETEAERRHLEMSRFSVSYVDLFIKSRKKGSMTAEERKAYEEEVEQFYKDKERLGCRYNISTDNCQGR